MITALKHDGGAIQTIDDPDDIDRSLDEGCLVWVDVTDLTEVEANRLIEEFSIDDLAVEDIRDGGLRAGGSTPRTKIEIYEHHAFIAAYSGDLCQVNLLIGERWVTTFRQPNEAGNVWSIDPVLARFKQSEITSLGRLVWCVLDALVDDCLDRAGELEGAIEKIEARIFGTEPLKRDDTQKIQRELFDIRRELSWYPATRVPSR